MNDLHLKSYKITWNIKELHGISKAIEGITIKAGEHNCFLTNPGYG